MPDSQRKSQAIRLRAASFLLQMYAAAMPLRRNELLAAYTSLWAPDTGSEIALVRSFERDLAVLRASAYDIETVKADAYAVVPGYRLNPHSAKQLELDKVEELLLHAALALLTRNEASRGDEIFALRCKIAALTGNLSTDFGDIIFENSQLQDTALSIMQAFNAGKQLAFSYAAPGQDLQTRQVSVQRLYFTQNRWHLLALRSDNLQLRNYLVQRISDARIVTDAAKQLPESQLSAKIAELESVLHAQHARIRVLHDTLQVQRFLADNSAVRLSSADEYSLLIGDVHLLKKQLAAIHTDVTVLEPSSLETQLHQLLTLIALQHQNNQQRFQIPSQRGYARNTAASRLSNAGRVQLFSALVALLAQRPLSLAELAAYFGLRAELLRECFADINTLFAVLAAEHSEFSGVQISVTSDAAAFAQLHGCGLFPAADFTNQELTVLSQAVAALVTGFSGALNRQADSLLAKLRAYTLNRGFAAPLNSVISSNAAGLSIDAKTARLLEDIVHCFTKMQALQFTYTPTNSGYATAGVTVPAKRTVLPAALVCSGSVWYLQGFCLDRRAERNFALDHIDQLEAVSRKRALQGANFIPPEADVDSLDVFQLLQSSGELAPSAAARQQQVQVLFAVQRAAKPALYAFSPVYYGVPVVDVDGDTHSDWQYGAVQLWRPENVLQLVCRAPGQLVVLDPPQLRTTVAAWADI